MFTWVKVHEKPNVFFVIFILSCSTDNTTITESLTVQPTKIVKSVPTETTTPKLKEPQATATTAVNPTVVPKNTSTPEPKFGSKPNTATAITPTSTPVSIPTQTPESSVPKNQVKKEGTGPTPTAIPGLTPSPTITSIPVGVATPESRDRHMFTAPSFKLTLNEEFNFDEIDYEISGLQNNEATTNQGVFKFEYAGSNVVLYWLPSLDVTPEDLLASAYQLLTNSQPENNFMIIGEGDLQLLDTTGNYGAFLISGEQGNESGGGLIGAWTCNPNKTDFVITVLSLDATVLQIRFDKLVNGFQCIDETKLK